METWVYEVSCKTTPGVLRIIRWLAYCAARAEGAQPQVAHDVQWAVGEILSNAAMHAYRGTVGPLEIGFELRNGRFQISVDDHGGPITTPIEIPERQPPYRGFGYGRRGLYAVSHLMDELEVTTNGQGDGVSVRMSKDLATSKTLED